MQNRFAATALIAVVGLAGCGSEAQSPATEDRTGRITIDGTTQEVHRIDCTQIQWLLTIDMATGPSRAEVVLRLGEEPVVQTVRVADFDGFNGVVGGESGTADVSATNGVYTITGSIQGSRRAPESKTVPFEIEAPC